MFIYADQIGQHPCRRYRRQQSKADPRLNMDHHSPFPGTVHFGYCFSIQSFRRWKLVAVIENSTKSFRFDKGKQKQTTLTFLSVDVTCYNGLVWEMKNSSPFPLFQTIRLNAIKKQIGKNDDKNKQQLAPSSCG